tara:strand:- start:1319 stop:1690 length:372 start_codon:yes stop_codon:yes gene_type:complete
MIQEIINLLTPSYLRIIIIFIAVYIYYNTYRKLSIKMIPLMLFPSFYIAYMTINYPENLNWRNPSPTIPSEHNVREEYKLLSKNKYKTITLFLPVYLLINYLLHKNKIDAIIYKYYVSKYRMK